MKKTQYTLLLALGVFFSILSACGTKAPAVVPVADRIKKSYTAESVTEGATVVYTRTGTSTKPGYSQFLLDLSSPPTVRYRAIDGTLFTGTYAIVGDTQLVLSNLTPQPTGTTGTITFTISDLADGSVTLTRTTADPKTGNTVNIFRVKG